MGKKHTTNMTLFILLIIISFVIIIFVDQNINNCRVNGCSLDKLYGSDFCYKHTCEQKNCYNVKNENEKYCPDHIEYYRKEKAKRDAENAKKPNCKYAGCQHKAEIGHSYCVLHECAATGCEKCETAGSL